MGLTMVSASSFTSSPRLPGHHREQAEAFEMASRSLRRPLQSQLCASTWQSWAYVLEPAIQVMTWFVSGHKAAVTAPSPLHYHTSVSIFWSRQVDAACFGDIAALYGGICPTTSTALRHERMIFLHDLPACQPLTADAAPVMARIFLSQTIGTVCSLLLAIWSACALLGSMAASECMRAHSTCRPTCDQCTRVA